MKQFPPEFKTMWASPLTKAAFVNDAQPFNPGHCENCGGLGAMMTFIASKGPFDHPGMYGEVSHWYNGWWWVGKSYEATCPVCQGSGMKPDYKPDYKPLHVLADLHKLENALDIKKEQYYDR